ncbi:hypothetical protein B0H19DRAFT_951704, partial [Mycena capillaripes]
LTAHDDNTLSSYFWAMHTDNIAAIDIAIMALLTMQYNLAAGTIAPWAEKRPELRSILKATLEFEVSYVIRLVLPFRLDDINVGTRADMMDDRSFVLNTPDDDAAKFMPPTIPLPNISLPRFAVVLAKLGCTGPG